MPVTRHGQRALWGLFGNVSEFALRADFGDDR